LVLEAGFRTVPNALTRPAHYRILRFQFEAIRSP
jgi:hypothetical protein